MLKYLKLDFLVNHIFKTWQRIPSNLDKVFEQKVIVNKPFVNLNISSIFCIWIAFIY